MIRVLFTMALIALGILFTSPLFEIEFLSTDWCLLAFADIIFCGIETVIIDAIWRD